MQGGGGKGEGVGRGDGEEGTPEAPEGGVGGDGGSISLFSPRTAPLSGRFGAARSPILQNPVWGRERNRSARPPGCQADVVGHLKFTEGGGRVKVMVSRARVVCECVRFRCRQAARSISPSRNIRGGAGPGDARGAGGSGRCSRGSLSPGPRPKWRARALAGYPLHKHSFFFPFPGTQESTHRAWVVLLSPSLKKKKKNAPVQSFLRLPARGSEDNITYVIYMHIKSLAGSCVCREFLCEEREGGGVGEGELGGSALRFTENSQQLVAECVRAHGRPATVPSSFRGRVGGGREGRNPGGVGGRLALPGQNGLQCSPRTCP